MSSPGQQLTYLVNCYISIHTPLKKHLIIPSWSLALGSPQQLQGDAVIVLPVAGQHLLMQSCAKLCCVSA